MPKKTRQIPPTEASAVVIPGWIDTGSVSSPAKSSRLAAAGPIATFCSSESRRVRPTAAHIRGAAHGASEPPAADCPESSHAESRADSLLRAAVGAAVACAAGIVGAVAWSPTSDVC